MFKRCNYLDSLSTKYKQTNERLISINGIKRHYVAYNTPCNDVLFKYRAISHRIPKKSKTGYVTFAHPRDIRSHSFEKL